MPTCLFMTSLSLHHNIITLCLTPIYLLLKRVRKYHKIMKKQKPKTRERKEKKNWTLAPSRILLRTINLCCPFFFSIEPYKSQPLSLAVRTYGKGFGLQRESLDSISSLGVWRGLSFPSLLMCERKRKKKKNKKEIPANIFVKYVKSIQLGIIKLHFVRRASPKSST